MWMNWPMWRLKRKWTSLHFVYFSSHFTFYLSLFPVGGKRGNGGVLALFINFLWINVESMHSNFYLFWVIKSRRESIFPFVPKKRKKRKKILLEFLSKYFLHCCLDSFFPWSMGDLIPKFNIFLQERIKLAYCQNITSAEEEILPVNLWS